jgi:hypothetical protein
LENGAFSLLGKTLVHIGFEETLLMIASITHPTFATAADLLLTILGIALAIGFIILVAWLLQKRFERRRIPALNTVHYWGEGPDPSPELTNKIRSHAVINIPDLKIITRLDVPFSRDSIVLLIRNIEPQSNLLRCHPDGTFVWFAKFTPLTYVHVDDIYTYVAWKQGKLVANTWSCYRNILDLKTGEILESRYTK